MSSVTVRIELLLCIIGVVFGSEPIILSDSSLPLAHGSCLMDARSVETRKLSMNNFLGCPEDTFYLCGPDVTKKYLVESCQKNIACKPGSSFQFVVDAEGNIHLECRPCPVDRFEPEPTESSNHSVIPGCTYRHLPSWELSEHLILFERGNGSTATKWMCNYEKEFYERNGNMFCDDIPTHSCKCIWKSCSHGKLLSADGQCVKCLTYLLPHKGFRCYDPNRDSDNQQGSAYGEVGKATTTSPNKDNDGLSVHVPSVVIPVVVGLFIIGLGLVWCCRRHIAGYGANDPENPPEHQANGTARTANRPETLGSRDSEETVNLTADHSSHSSNTEHCSPHIGKSVVGNIQAKDCQINVQINMPDGNINMPNGMGPMPNGTMPTSNGTVPMPNGTTPRPNGTTNASCDSSDEGEQAHLWMKTLKCNPAEENCVTDSSNLQMQILKE